MLEIKDLNKLKSTIELYRNDIVKFIEDFTGVKLTPVQKILLNIEYKNKLMIVPRRHGYKHSVDMVNKIKKQLLEEE